MKQVAGQMRLDMASFRELAAFAQFGSDLDEATRRQLERGLRVQETLKQGQYSPVPLADQIIMFYAATNGYLDDVEVRRIPELSTAFVQYMKDSHPDLMQSIATGAKLDKETQDRLGQAIEDFKSTMAY
jgi:F-type H+-transporting ATPase subunit alpha